MAEVYTTSGFPYDPRFRSVARYIDESFKYRVTWYFHGSLDGVQNSLIRDGGWDP